MPEPEHQTPPARNEAQPAPPAAAARNPWPYAVMWVVVVLIAATSGLYVFKSCLSLPRQMVVQVGEQLQKVAAAFNQGTITTTFTSYATTISGNEYFQFASLSQTENFSRKDESSTAFGYVQLPEVVVEATAPVTYTYYLDLTERWDFLLQNGVIYVTAPDIKYNKPAVDASRITYDVKKDSLIRNTTEAKENLKNSITWLSYKKAEANIGLVRETGRKQTEIFVENWLERRFADGKSYAVKVRFRSEVQTNGLGPVVKPERLDR